MMMGGEKVSIFRVTDMLSVGYVHALMLIMLSIWAVGALPPPSPVKSIAAPWSCY